MFYDLANELIWLVDNGAFIPRPVISKILDNGQDVFQYIEYALPYKTDFSLLDDSKERGFYLELLIRQYTGGREKHMVAKNNGLLLLLQLCIMLSRDEFFDPYKDVKIDFYLGKMEDSQMWNLKYVGVKYDDISAY